MTKTLNHEQLEETINRLIGFYERHSFRAKAIIPYGEHSVIPSYIISEKLGITLGNHMVFKPSKKNCYILPENSLLVASDANNMIFKVSHQPFGVMSLFWKGDPKIIQNGFYIGEYAYRNERITILQGGK